MPSKFSLTHQLGSKNTLKFLFPSLQAAKLALIVLFCIISSPTYAADTPATESEKAHKKADGTNNPLLISTEDPKLKAEKEFSKIKSYESYDPITDTWSTIEDFEDVEILDEVDKKPANSYIYRSFWAYDPLTHEWYRVDISEYGYRKVTAADLAAEDDDLEEDDEEKKEWSFWRNLGMSLSAGYGVTWYMCQIKNMDLLARPNQKEFFLQPRNTHNAVYKLQWFTQRPIKINTLEHANLFNDYTKVTHDHTFISAGWMNLGWVNIPITMSLHYTFFNRLRLGIGGNIEISYLTKLLCKNADGEKIEYELPRPWFANLKYFVTLGYKFYKGEKNSFFIDGRIGMALDYGNREWPLKSLLKTLGEYEYTSLYASIGPSHEIRLNSFFKFFYGLYFQYKRFDNDVDFGPVNNAGAKPSMLLWQPGLHLETGITLHFGRDKKEEPEEDEEDNEEDQEEGIDEESKPITDDNDANGELQNQGSNNTTVAASDITPSQNTTDEITHATANEASTDLQLDNTTQLEDNDH
jgi:hypothetical protein